MIFPKLKWFPGYFPGFSTGFCIFIMKICGFIKTYTNLIKNEKKYFQTLNSWFLSGFSPGFFPGYSVFKSTAFLFSFSFQIRTSIGKTTLLLIKPNNRETPGRKPGENPRKKFFLGLIRFVIYKNHVFSWLKPKNRQKPGITRWEIRENHGNIRNIICHLETLNIFIFWIRFASQQISYCIEMVKPETGKKPVKMGRNPSHYTGKAEKHGFHHF